MSPETQEPQSQESVQEPILETVYDVPAKKVFGHTSSRKPLQYPRWETDGKGRLRLIPPPVKPKHVKPADKRISPKHPLMRWLARSEALKKPETAQ